MSFADQPRQRAGIGTWIARIGVTLLFAMLCLAVAGALR